MIRVACAIIQREGKVLATRRSAAMSNPLKWEFPGGKIEEGETPEQCLVREIREELCLDILIRQKSQSVFYSYPDFDLALIPFVCDSENGGIRLKEHLEYIWILPDNLPDLDWSAADVPVMENYLSSIHLSS